MSNPLIPMVGTKWNRWTVSVYDSDKSVNGRVYYKCVCDCGTIKSVRADGLKSGVSTSCGCFKKEKLIKRVTTHGMSKQPLHNKWISMTQRCSNPHGKRYKNYGGRDISVCKEWLNSFEAFYEWSMKNGYASNLTLDRIDNNGNYCPENCRYITNAQQQLNRSNNHYVAINGISKTIKEWCDLSGVNRNLFNWRLWYGWTGVKLLRPANTGNYK